MPKKNYYYYYYIPENPGESTEECSRKVRDVLKELGADPDNTMFHAIHRIGETSASSTASTSAANNENQKYE